MRQERLPEPRKDTVADGWVLSLVHDSVPFAVTVVVAAVTCIAGE
ncbi:hypothetical protein ACFV6F_15005 [Kitasatospora phosalacinea]